nr:hypothetical protein [Lacticaseibacillus thailandensis]
MAYVRRGAQKAIVRALQSVGGTATRDDLKAIIAEDDDSGFSHDDVYGTVISKNGNPYIPFNLDFNFGIRDLAAIGYIEKPVRGAAIVLTEQGRADPLTNFPNKQQLKTMGDYWSRTTAARRAKNAKKSKIPGRWNDGS